MCADQEETARPAHSKEDESCGAPVIDHERLEDHGCLARHNVCIDQARRCFAFRADFQYHVVHCQVHSHLSAITDT